MYILFDLDGTLIDPFKRLHIIYKQLTRKHSLPYLSLEHYVLAKKKKMTEPFYMNNDKKGRAYNQEKENLLESIESLKHDTVFQDAEKILERLQTRHRLILITVRKNRKSLLRQLKRLGLDSYFSSIYSPYMYELNKKPEETKHKLIVRFIQDYPAEKKIVFIGDTEADILAGKKMGIPTIAVTRGLRTKTYLKALQPDYLIDNLQQLTPIIEKIEKES